MNKHKYIVKFDMHGSGHITVEAKSEVDAMRQVRKLSYDDYDYYSCDEYDDWKINDIVVQRAKRLDPS